MTPYNGHPSWDHWNVALWINNDEGLYNLARECAEFNPAPAAAAREFIREVGADRTPDGAKYTISRIAPVMRELRA